MVPREVTSERGYVNAVNVHCVGVAAGGGVSGGVKAAIVAREVNTESAKCRRRCREAEATGAEPQLYKMSSGPVRKARRFTRVRWSARFHKWDPSAALIRQKHERMRY